jgi:iron complex outermembrane receptor protein
MYDCLKRGPAPAAVLWFFLGMPLPGSAQTGTVLGTVAAPDGARLPGATVTLVRLETGGTSTGATTDVGTFRFTDVTAGTYDLTAIAPGFRPAMKPGIVVVGGGTVSADLVLDVALVSEAVTVIGFAPRDHLEATELQRSGARDVGEALSSMAGLAKLRKGGIANDVVVRALQSRDLNVLIDGQRLYGACPNHMDPAAFHVDFAEVERVEVAKGPFDLKNQGSLGGAINVVTRKPTGGWHLAPSFTGGADGFVAPSVNASYGGARLAVLGGYSYRRSLAYTDGSGQRITEAANYRPDAVDSEAFRAGTFWARAFWTVLPGDQLHVSYASQQADHVLYPYLLMDAIYDDSNRVQLSYERQRTGAWLTSLKAQAYLTRVDHWMTDEYRSSSTSMPRAWSMGTMAGTQTVGGRVEGIVRGASVGVEAYEREWDTTTELAGRAYRPQNSIPGVSTADVGAFLEYSWPASSSLTVIAGGRADWIRTTADASKADTTLYLAYHGTDQLEAEDVLPSAKARVTWQVRDGLELAGGIGHTERVAEANERFFALRRMGSDWVGNPDLDPSRNTGADVVLTWRRAGAQVSATLFVNAIDGFITVYDQPRQRALPGVMNQAARSYANVDALLRGLEASIAVPLSPRVSISGDLSAVRGTQTPRPELGITSHDLAEVPPLRGSARVRYDDGRFFGLLEGVFDARQDRVDTDLNETVTPGYGIANIQSGVRRGALSLTVGLANVLDRTYREHLSYQRDPFRSGVTVNEPGRNAFVSASWRF